MNFSWERDGELLEKCYVSPQLLAGGRVVDVQSGGLIGPRSVPTPSRALWATPMKGIVRVTADGRRELYRVARKNNYDVTLAWVSETMLVTVTDFNNLTFWEHGKLVKTVPWPPFITLLAAADAGMLIIRDYDHLTGYKDDAIIWQIATEDCVAVAGPFVWTCKGVLDAATGALVRRTPRLSSVVLSPSGLLGAFVNGSRIVVVDVRTGAVRAHMDSQNHRLFLTDEWLYLGCKRFRLVGRPAAPPPRPPDGPLAKCSVCLDDRWGTRLTCGHDCCRECIEKWRAAGGRTCPVCRAWLNMPAPPGPRAHWLQCVWKLMTLRRI